MVGVQPDFQFPARVPQRTCVGCRNRGAKSDLLRVVAIGSDLVPDVRMRQQGRGAYLHPDPACLDRAVRRRAFPRALRVAGPLSIQAVDACVADMITAAGSGD